MSNIITGLDIGSSQIKCVVVERMRDGTLSVVSAFRFPSCGLRRGVVTDTEEAVGSMNKLGQELRAISEEAVKRVYVNLDSEYVKVRLSRGIAAVGQPDKEIKQDDVDRAVQASRAAKSAANYKVLHTINREFTVDDVGDIYNPVGMAGNRIEVSTLIVECFAPHLEVLVSGMEDAGLQMAGVVYGPFAAARAALSKQQKELGCALLDFGGGTTSILVFEEQRPLYAKTFPVGSGYITGDLAVGLKISMDLAERLKCEYGSALAKKVSRRDIIRYADLEPGLTDETSRRFLSEIIEVRVAEIIELVNNELAPLKERFQLPAGVVAVGGGVKLDGFTDLIRQTVKLPAQIGAPNVGRFEISSPAHEELLQDPEFAAAAGLVLIGNDALRGQRRSAWRAARKFLRNLLP